MARVECEDYTIPGQIRESSFAKLRLDRQYLVGCLISRLGVQAKARSGRGKGRYLYGGMTQARLNTPKKRTRRLKLRVR